MSLFDNDELILPEPNQITLLPLFYGSSSGQNNDEKKNIHNELDKEIQSQPIKKSITSIINHYHKQKPEKQNDEVIIEDSRRTKYQFEKVQLLEICNFCLSLLTIICGISDHSHRMDQGTPTTFVTTPLLSLCSILTLILMISTVIRQQFQLELAQLQKIDSMKTTLFSHEYFPMLSFELFLLIFHPNLACIDVEISSLNYYDFIYIQYQLNDFLTLIMLSRMYTLFRVLLNTTLYSNTRASRICRMYGVDCSYFYAAKCLMSETPLITVNFLFIFSIVVGGQALKICEQPLVGLQTANIYNDLGTYLNCFWLMVITMTTVGYGDYFARTIPGRLVTIIACIIGVFLVSIMVVALTNTLNMTSPENKSFNIIQRLEVRESLAEQAADFITLATKYALDYKNNRVQEVDKIDRVEEIKQVARQFMKTNRDLRSMYDSSSVSEEMARNFDYLKEDIKQIFENQILLRDYLLKLKRTTQIEQNDDEASILK